MWYYGKRMDTYAHAINMLFLNAGLEKVPYLNCITKRNFALCCSGKVDGWFKTCVSARKASQEINRYLFPEKYQIKCIEGVHFSMDSMQELTVYGCVVGPLSQEPAIGHLKYRIYRGAEHYVYLKISRDGRIMVSDPLGTPVWFPDEREFENMIKNHGVFLTWLKKQESLKNYSVFDWKEVLKAGFDYHKLLKQRKNGTAGYFWSDNYSRSSSEHTGLHLALNHYILQTSEVAELLEQVMGKTIGRDKISGLFQKIYRIKYTQEVEKLSDLDRQIWELLDEQFELFTVDRTREM